MGTVCRHAPAHYGARPLCSWIRYKGRRPHRDHSDLLRFLSYLPGGYDGSLGCEPLSQFQQDTATTKAGITMCVFLEGIRLQYKNWIF